MNRPNTPIRLAEEALFSHWKAQLTNQQKLFISDGVVNPIKWTTAKKKILFLLKEVNGADDAWDERDYLAHYNTKEEYIKTHSPTITALIQWIHAVMADSAVDWSTVEKELQDTAIQSNLLAQIALVNVKKSPGKGIVDGEAFDSYWKNPENRQNLMKQLAIYSASDTPPDFIICGGTAWYYNALFKDTRLDWQTTSRGIPYCRHNNAVIIDYCHPQARIAANIKYYALYDAIQEICSR